MSQLMMMGVGGETVVVSSGTVTSPSYTFQAAIATQAAGGTTVTSSAFNAGSGAVFTILGLGVGLTTQISAITLNGFSLGNITGFSSGGASGQSAIYAGACTVTGTSDVIVMTSTAGFSFIDINLFIYAAKNLVSNTAVSNAVVAAGVSQAIQGAAAVGNFVFAVGTQSGTSQSFSGSAQTPNSSHTLFGAFNLGSVMADWTALSSGITAGNFVATSNSTQSDMAMAVWH